MYIVCDIVYMYSSHICTYSCHTHVHMCIGVLTLSQFLPLTCTYLLHNLWRTGGKAWWTVSHECERMWRGTWRAYSSVPCIPAQHSPLHITSSEFKQ